MSRPALKRFLGWCFERKDGRASLAKRFLVAIAELEASLSRRWVAAAHWRLRVVKWHLPPSPHYFDHHADLFHRWIAARDAMWLERGAFNAIALKGGAVLELACGDGFYARNFYSLRSASVVACDGDPEAIATARKKNPALNVTFVVADIRTQMPQGVFENVVWDFAFPILWYFTVDEAHGILSEIKTRLAPDGVFSGYTTTETRRGYPEQEHQIRSMEDLQALLSLHFANVTVFETPYDADGRNLYYWASDGPIPFGEGWPHLLAAPPRFT